MENAFILGNGTSRLQLDLNILKGKGKIYGCNNLYTEFTPDVLVATDRPIATKIQESGYSKNNVMYTRDPLQLHGAHKIIKNWAYSSGPVAVTLAAIDQIPYIYMIGMDLQGLKGNKKQPERRFNNVYADSQFYKQSTQVETHYMNWVEQITQIMKEYKSLKFFHVNPHQGYTPQEWIDSPNLDIMPFKQFLESINTL